MDINYYSLILEKEGKLSDNFNKSVKIDKELRNYLMNKFKLLSTYQVPVIDITLYFIYSLNEEDFYNLKNDTILKYFISKEIKEDGRLIFRYTKPKYCIGFISTDGIQNNIKELFKAYANIVVN